MSRQRFYFLALLASLTTPLPACSGGNQQVLDDAAREKEAVAVVKTYVQKNLDDFAAASAALAAAAPAPDADGWSSAADEAAVDAMKAEWKKARAAYESIEGAIAVVFPSLDVSTDARYDAFIALNPDDNLFDGDGVIGVHAIERILWSDQIPASVVAFESGLPFYKAAVFPSNQTQAADFKDKLCARLASDSASMTVQWKGLALDAPSAFRGVVGSVHEQVEKVEKAATGEEESRYAQFTLADMRANVAAAEAIYGAFQPWLRTKEGGAQTDDKIKAALAKLKEGYAKLSGDALPAVPAGWSSENPTSEQLMTPFGTLWTLVRFQSDPAQDGSLVFAMSEAGDILGL
jgi:iron uptake system component EfeO